MGTVSAHSLSENRLLPPGLACAVTGVLVRMMKEEFEENLPEAGEENQKVQSPSLSPLPATPYLT